MQRGRKKGDGRGRLGGRVAGTPNKDNPLKDILHEHSMAYFMPSIAAEDVELFKDEAKKAEFVNNHMGMSFSQFDLDLLCMKPADRAKLEADILAFHTPKMQAISAEVGVTARNMTMCERLQKIANGEEIPPGE